MTPAEAPAGPFIGLDREALLALPAAEREDRLAAEIARRAAAALGIPGEPLARDRPLTAAGLDSLAAVELRNGVEQALGLDLPLARLLDGASAAELAREALAPLATNSADSGGNDPASPTGAESGEGSPGIGRAVPLSWGQRSLWFLNRLAPASSAYVIAGAAHVAGALDPAALERALTALVERHAALRTFFAVTAAGEPEPREAPAEEASTHLGFAVVEAAGWSAEELAAGLGAEAWRPFDLERGPLLHAALFDRGAAGWDVVLAVHHIAADLWSLEVLLAELAALYRQALAGAIPASAGAAASRSYTDFARRQERLLAGADGERLWDFWRQTLIGPGGAPPRLDLPTDRPRPRTLSLAGAAVPVSLPHELDERLRALGAASGATLFMTLLAGFQALLARWSGQEDLLVGAPTSGRAGRGAGAFAETVGYFVNPIALRADLRGNPSFDDHLGRTRTAALAAFAHQEYPFPLLAERLQPERDPGRAPLVQAFVALQRARGPHRALGAFALGMPGAQLNLGGLQLESLPLSPAGAQFDLTLIAAEGGRPGDGLTAQLVFATDLYDRATVERAAGHLVRLLESAAAAPAAPLWELPLLSPHEESQVAVAGERTAPPSRCLHDLFAETARAHPEAWAIVDGEERLTYADLQVRSHRLARALARRGVEPEVAVAVCLAPSPLRAVAILAVLQAGGFYVSLDPSHPPERLAGMVADAACQILLTDVPTAASLPALTSKTEVLALDHPDLAAHFASEDPRPLPPRAKPENLAYLIYTSGSTGAPKGVAVRHDSLVNLLACHLRLYPAGLGDRTTQVAGPAFDASVWELWFALAAGAEIHVPPRAAVADPDRLAAWLHQERITQAFVPTPVADLLLQDQKMEVPAVSSSRLPATLRLLFVGGDRLRRRPHPGAPFAVVNCYGPAETTVISVWGSVPPEGPVPQSPTIGRPVDNLRAYVLGRHLQPLPQGATGELFVAGIGLARGYVHRPDLTAARFLPDPHASLPGERMYATGDRVRHRLDGDLDCLGRADDQVKIRGVRVEPGEVEAALTRHPALRQALVLTRDDGPEGPTLVAYLVPVPGQPAPRNDELRSFLRETLIESMVPTRFVTLPALPLTPNGKPDRQSLPPPRRCEFQDTFAAPETEVEELLAAIWREVLHVENVGIHDDFFDLGGHSLKVNQVLARVREAFDLDLPLSTLFAAPTIASLAQAIAQALLAELDEPSQAEALAAAVHLQN